MVDPPVLTLTAGLQMGFSAVGRKIPSDGSFLDELLERLHSAPCPFTLEVLREL
jgi:hypothetical protein